jgi:hypothetical protein
LVGQSLLLYFADYRAGRFGICTGDIIRNPPDHSDYRRQSLHRR